MNSAIPTNPGGDDSGHREPFPASGASAPGPGHAGGRGEVTGAAGDGYEPRPFHPAGRLRNAHLQTLGGKLLRPTPSLPLRRRRLSTPDGDFVDLDEALDPGPRAPVVLVLHGLEGSTSRPYVLLTLQALTRRGMLAVGLNFRSCSGEPNRLARSYHSGDTGDLALVLEHLEARYPGRPLGVIGFSLGGNVLLKFLGERGDNISPWVRGAAAVSVPYDLDAGARVLERWPMGRLYTQYFLGSLKRKTALKRELLEGLVDLERVRRARTLREFDEALTAPVHGFRDASDYYRKSSCIQWLRSIRVTTLLLHSRDDPFMPMERLPGLLDELSPALTPAFTERGGHVGFVEEVRPGSFGFWAEDETARFLEYRLSQENP